MTQNGFFTGSGLDGGLGRQQTKQVQYLQALCTPGLLPVSFHACKGNKAMSVMKPFIIGTREKGCEMQAINAL